MNLLLPLLIVAAAPDAPIEARYPEAVTVFHCTFDASWEKNFDGWPDGWTRRRGPGFPHYLSAKIAQEPSPQGDKSLRIDLDGRGAVAYSPPIDVCPLFAYVLEGYLRTEGLEHDRAYFSVTLLDAKRHRLQTFYSRKVRQTPGWKKLRLGPISPGSDQVRLAIIGLHLQPQEREDLRGSALFDDVWLGRLPRLAISTSDAYNFFDQADQVEVHCVASGLIEERCPVTFQLEDALGQELALAEHRLETGPAETGQGPSPGSSPEEAEILVGKTTWKPPIAGPGFYRVRATMKGRKALVLQQELTLAVVEPPEIPAGQLPVGPVTRPTGGSFGWTLPRGDRTLPLPQLRRVISQAGINWVKYPLWYDGARSDEMIERMVGFAERLGEQGIELVGLLHDPPESISAGDGPSKSQTAAEIFAPEPKVWYPSLKPVMSRLATRVRWWQLGHDKDTSFVDCPNLTGKIAQVKAELDRIGQDVNVGIGWGWMNQLPQAATGKAPWRFLALSADPPTTHQELATYLDASRDAGPKRWVVIEPLPKDSYPVEVRATDLVRRMIAAKIHGAEAVFCPEPFSTQRGLMNDDGTPGELFFPWRTAARALGEAEFLGSIRLPGGSPNRVFARADDVVMVVWNDQPTEEVIYLGEDVRQTNLWGRSFSPSRQEHRQVLQVGRLPSLVTGIDGPITRWRLDFQLAQRRIPSIFGRPHANSLRLKNHFVHPAVGQATLVAPETWKVSPRQPTLWLAEGEESQQGFEITLPPDATSGRHLIRVDFELQAERSYRFSAYREIEVGLGDVYIEIMTQLNDRGELEVSQRLFNQDQAPVSFRCQLLTPGRRRQKTQIIGLGPGRDDKLYRLPNGSQLIGKTLWLRADEIGGPRVLNYRFVAEP